MTHPADTDHQDPALSDEDTDRLDTRTNRAETVIADWTSHLASHHDVKVGQHLPPHSPRCAGCGPDNPAGLHLNVVRTRDGVEAVVRFTEAQEGAPGIAHGGAVALAFDDLFGFALYTVGSLAVTRSLTVEYQAPFRLHRDYVFRAHLAEREGRRLALHAEAWDEIGKKAGSSNATFIIVKPVHFEPDGRRPWA